MPIRKTYERADGLYALLGEFQRSPTRADYKQRFYVDIRNNKGYSCNDNKTPCSVTLTDAVKWLQENGFEEGVNTYG
jgi:hypothetical protein